MENKIKESIIKQLKDQGADAEQYKDLIDEYIFCCNQEKKAQDDVIKRGHTYEAVSSSGIRYERNNPSVRATVRYNNRKLAILKKLGLTTQNVIKNNK
jgi:hypothetical protein